MNACLSLETRTLAVVQCVKTLLALQQHVVLAIDGGTAAGKSSLAAQLAARFHCVPIQTSDFFLPLALRTPARLHEAGGMIDYARFAREVSPFLGTDAPFSYRVFDYDSDTFTKSKTILPCAVTIVEGIYSHHPALCAHYDLHVFLKIDASTQKERILQQGDAALYENFKEQSMPMEHQYFDVFNIDEKSDFTL